MTSNVAYVRVSGLVNAAHRIPEEHLFNYFPSGIGHPRLIRSFPVFSRMLRDSTPRYVGLLVGRSVGRLVQFFFFCVFEFFEPTAPAQML